LKTTLGQTRVLSAGVTFAERTLAKPLLLSTGPISVITEATARVRVRCGTREAEGAGSICLSDLWAWPEPALDHGRRDAAMRSLAVWMAEGLAERCGEPAHPLELGLRLHERVMAHHPEPVPGFAIPALAVANSLSPFDAAIHDAAGQALGLSAFSFYGGDEPLPLADGLFPKQDACRAIRAMLRPDPLRALPAWLIVGKADDLEREVRPWVRDRGYGCFKLKIMGKSAAEDAVRVVEVYRAVRAFGAGKPRLSVDSNEGNADAAGVLEFLERLRALDREAFAALEYLEQPTSRDIVRHAQDWRPVCAVKPVLLDEGLESFGRLRLAEEQGWAGLALKTCKGHSFALAAAAWARERGLPVALQDLTNPGLSAIHAAWFAAFVPTLNGVELNSPQFLPAANAAWLPRLAGLLDPQDGLHRLSGPVPVGLGGGL
jgi:L-alanine-DL-glutamate epimerase-like enolase superfamily enzyme